MPGIGFRTALRMGVDGGGRDLRRQHGLSAHGGHIEWRGEGGVTLSRFMSKFLTCLQCWGVGPRALHVLGVKKDF